MTAEIIPIRGGYAAPPGSGPKGQTCGTCDYTYGFECADASWHWPDSALFCSETLQPGDPPPPVRESSPACQVWRARR